MNPGTAGVPGFNIKYSPGLFLAFGASRLNNLATMMLAEMKKDC